MILYQLLFSIILIFTLIATRVFSLRVVKIIPVATLYGLNSYTFLTDMLHYTLHSLHYEVTTGLAPSGNLLAHFGVTVLHNAYPPELPKHFKLLLNKGPAYKDYFPLIKNIQNG